MISIVCRKTEIKTNYLLLLDLFLFLIIFLFLVNFYKNQNHFFKTSLNQDYFETEEFYLSNTGVLPDYKVSQEKPSE